MKVGDQLYCIVSCCGGHFKVGKCYRISLINYDTNFLSMDAYGFTINNNRSYKAYFITMQELRKKKLEILGY